MFDAVADREPVEGSTESPAPSEVEGQSREPESKQEQSNQESSAQEKESANDPEKESDHDTEKESSHDPEKESSHDEEQAPGQSGKSDVLAHTMRQMEQSYGQDFGQVGVSPTLQSSEAGGAKAVATEEHIAYDPAAVDLSSHEGKKILGHELSHIVQKRKGQVVSDAVDHQIDPEGTQDEPHQSQHEPHGAETDQSSQRESLEQEADDAGERAANGQPAHVAAGAKAPRNQFFGLKDIGKFAKGAWNQTKKGVSSVWNTVKNADWKKIGKTTLDVATDFIPGISNVKDAYQAISGVNPVTGEKLGWGSRILSGIFAIPGVGNIAKYIGKGGKLLGKLATKLGPKAAKWIGKGLHKLGPLLKKGGKWAWDKLKKGGKSIKHRWQRWRRGYSDADVSKLIKDTNPKFPMAKHNAEVAFKGPPGTKPLVAGSGVAGGDLKFVNAKGEVVFQREVKCITGKQSAFNSSVSHAVEQIGKTGEVFVQVPAGTDALSQVNRFRGIARTPEQLAKYKDKAIKIVDETGKILYDGKIIPEVK